MKCRYEIKEADRGIECKIYCWLIGHPNWRALAPNIRIFAANNVVGLFEQGDGFNKDAAFGNMKILVMSHLMWDPTLNAHKLNKKASPADKRGILNVRT